MNESSQTIAVDKIPKASKLGRFFYGIKSLLKGLGVTLSYFVRPSTVVTQQYPENRETLKLPDRTRSIMSMNHDDNGYHNCTACHICEQACPNASIHVLERAVSASGRKELDTFIWRLDTCTFCNLCVLVCPFQVLKMSSSFESSVYDQSLLIFNLSKYAGPTATALMKIEDVEARKKMVEPRSVYDGPTTLNGVHLAGLPPEFMPQSMPQEKTKK